MLGTDDREGNIEREGREKERDHIRGKRHTPVHKRMCTHKTQTHTPSPLAELNYMHRN